MNVFHFAVPTQSTEGTQHVFLYSQKKAAAELAQQVTRYLYQYKDLGLILRTYIFKILKN